MRILAPLFLLALVACAPPPHIDTLSPASGPPRTLVEVNGKTLSATAYWDANTPTETRLMGALLGAQMFSVPGGATVGPHDVQLRKDGDNSNVVPFTVTAPVPFGPPRIDRVGLHGTEFRPGNKIMTWLWIQGANIDVGAVVYVNGAVQPTVSMRGLRNELFGVEPASLGFPIYHYLALAAAPGERNTGEALTIQVQNLDQVMGTAIRYTLPTDSSDLDSDGDDLPDKWEVDGYDANNDGIIDIDLKALGADPHRPDVFLELDVMTDLANAPTPEVFQAMIDAFAAAPLVNAADANGIHLVIDRSGTVPFWQNIDLWGLDNSAAGFANFYTLKASSFDNAIRGRIYHYCIWGNNHPSNISGISDADLEIARAGDDCIVTLDDFNAVFQTVRTGAETLMHEVGHNLGQRHGGVGHFANNPAYNSVMSYNWQLRSGRTDGGRRLRPVCVPLYYRQNGAVEVNGALPAVVGTALDYSHGMGQSLVESRMNENLGVCNNVPVDWNGDANIAASVFFDVNTNGFTDTWTDYPNWAAMRFWGPRRNGMNLP